ncbi:MAG: calcium/sodium antiporter [Chromatiaceae bacterium]|nr:calcium/sodium antiporter [Chromatiaceae bacterium]
MSAFFIPVLFILPGFVLLVGGGELLVRAATALARAARISALVIGLTVVAFGTSAPELAVTLQATWSGAGDLALGNVIGSNIANILLVLGLAALMAPLWVERRVLTIDLPLVVAASLALWLLGLDGRLGTIDGALLFATLLVYLIGSVRAGRRDADASEARDAGSQSASPGPQGCIMARNLALLLLGLLLLALGSRLLVMGAIEIARLLGVSELVIGLTVVAIGTSLPEVATSVIASLRGARDLAIGNVIGSNLFNLLAVLGLGALVAPEPIPVAGEALRLDLPVMIIASLICLPLLGMGRHLGRLEGSVFLLAFAAYLGQMVWRA